MTPPVAYAEHTILKVLVGSQAHGLADSGSDADYRSVFVIPTAELFRVGFKYQGAKMIKEGIDETSWEIGLFLHLASECYPLALETLIAPVVEADRWGEELRTLLPALWSPRQAYTAFLGYCENQRKKMLDKKDGRPAKYAAAYIRVLYNLCELLEKGTYTMRIGDTPLGQEIRKLKEGHYRAGEVIDVGEFWTEEASRRLVTCTHQPNPELVDEFLLRLRKAFLS